MILASFASSVHQNSYCISPSPQRAEGRNCIYQQSWYLWRRAASPWAMWMQNGRLQGPWEPLCLVTDCSHKFSLQLSSKDHYLTFPIDAELWPCNRWQKYKGVCVEYIERIWFSLGLLLNSSEEPPFLCVSHWGTTVLAVLAICMWTSWLGLSLFALLDVNKMFSHFKSNSETAMGYFGSTVLGKKLVFCLLPEFFKHIRILVYSSCMKLSILILSEW